MHELVLVLSDFYVSQETPDRELPAGVALPGLQYITRFGTRSKLASGWRPWLSRWLTGAEASATATVASASIQTVGLAPGTVAWMATPMHLIAGMTSVHVDRRSILRLDASDQATLATDFQRVFHDSGFHLQSLEAGDFLMLGPQMPVARAQEPARSLGGSMAQHADTSVALRRLGAEIEMWLHDHPVNDTRRRRGDLPVTSLWLWGAGAVPAGGGAGAERATSLVDRGVSRDVRAEPAGNDVGAIGGDAGANAASSDIAFGRDSYLQGLWALRGAKVSSLPQQPADVFGYPHAQRAVLVIEIGVMLQSNPRWTFFEAVADIDRRFIAPAVEALKSGQCQRLIVLANDYELTLRASDRLKFWRRTPSGLSGLQ